MAMTFEEHAKAAIKRMKRHFKSQSDSEVLSQYAILSGADKARLMQMDIAVILRHACKEEEDTERTPEQQKVISDLSGCPRGFCEESGHPLYWLDAVRDFVRLTGLDMDKVELMWTVNYFDNVVVGTRQIK